MFHKFEQSGVKMNLMKFVDFNDFISILVILRSFKFHIMMYSNQMYHEY